MTQMNSARPETGSDLRNARRIGVVFAGYAIVLPFVIFLIPESELPVSTGPIEALSWLMILMMPIEILLLYVFYRFFRSKSDLNNIMDAAILMYVFATVPSIYALIIGFIGSAIRLLAIPLGLVFSLIGLWLASMFVSKLGDMSVSSD
jgi:hypothetical protein